MKESVRKLQEAYEKFDVLKSTSLILGLRGALEAAAALRHNVTEDKEIIEACTTCPEESKNRKKFLDEITLWINDMISKSSEELPKEINISDAQVKNFDEAKNAMVEMIEEEQANNIFNEPTSPKLLEDIEDCKKHTHTICRVAENCKNGKFLALVLGDFQSGKSTTIDALCDGRHISAIGDGTATSAVLVLVSYGEKESFKIYWRTKDQFLPIFERIKRIMPEYEWVSFDLDKSEERIKLTSAIDIVRCALKEKKLNQEDVKFLMLCDLILAFYGTKILQAKTKSLQALSNVAEITRFPKDGEAKWKKGGVNNFTIEDAIFVFIDSVSCTTPSETLKKLNCTVIDSPGLFNSAYDTMVTRSAMVAAHAIIYVLPHHKGIGQDVCGSLYAIKDLYPDVHKKLFIVNNMDTLKDSGFIESNREFIKAEFGSEKEVYVYDAKVAYLCQLKYGYDKGLASNADITHLMHARRKTPIGIPIELNFKTFDEAWDFHINSYKTAYGCSSEAPHVDTYLKYSGFTSMVDALKVFIEKNEAYAVILSNALIPMRNELMSINRELSKRFIEPYTKSHDDIVTLWKARINNAEKFQKIANSVTRAQLFSSPDSRSLYNRISQEEYKKIFSADFYEEMAREIAYVLYDNKGQLLVTKTLFKQDKELFKQRFGDIVFPLISEKLTTMITNRMKYALEMMESGQDNIIENLFVPVTSNIRMILEKEWNQLYKDDGSFKMYDYINIPKNLKNCVVARDSTAPGTDIMSSGTIGLTLLSGLVLQISAVVAGVAAMITGYIGAIMCDPTGISQTTAIILFALLGIGGMFIGTFAPDWLRDKFANTLKDMVLPKLKEQGPTGFRDIICSQMDAILNRYADGISVNIQKMKNERDIALAPNPNQEQDCFRAVELINKISGQVSVYDGYKNIFIKE